MASYRTCPYCGANLDPGEKCECRKTEEYLEGKRAFIVRLKLCLLEANVGLADLKLLDDETVEVTYTNGYKRKINIAMDSRIAIVRDVAIHI